MTHILALIDASAYAASVGDYAAWAAGELGGDIELLHVLAPQARAQSDLSGAIGLGAKSALLDDLSARDAQAAKAAKDEGRALLDGTLAQLEAKGFHEVSLSLRHGALDEALSRHPSDLMVIGKRGEDHAGDQEHLGGNLERVIRAAERPVLVANRAFHTPDTAVFAYDDGPSARKGLEWLCARPFDAHMAITVLSIAEPGSDRAAAAQHAAQQLRDAGYDARDKCAVGDADKVIAAEAQSAGVNMLIMGAYGHSRIRSLILGSTTSAMIATIRIPLLLFR